MTEQYRRLDAVAVHKEVNANKSDVKKVIWTAACVAVLDLFVIPIFGVFIAVKTLSFDILGDYATCDGWSSDCHCDNLGEDDWCYGDDDWVMGMMYVFSIPFLCCYEGFTLAMETFVFLFYALWGEHTLLAAFVNAFGKCRLFLGASIHFGGRLLELIFIIVFVATYKDIGSCYCDDDDTVEAQLGHSYYARTALGLYMKALLILVSMFTISRRCIMSLIRNVRVTERTQLMWLTVFDEQRVQEYETYQ